MRKIWIGGLGCAAAGLVISAARADYVDLAVILESAGQITFAGPRDVYRVYAEFTNPTDRVDAWYGTPDHPFTIQNVLANGTSLGTGFQNFGGIGGTLPPEVPGSVLDWDTWATIGVAYLDEAAPDYLNVTPGFPTFISGNSVTADNASVFLSDTTAPQGRADFRVIGNDTALRVLLMQLVVNVGEHVRGTINVDGQIGAPGSYTPFSAVGQTFSSVPGPGGLAALVVAGIVCGRRRRLAALF